MAQSKASGARAASAAPRFSQWSRIFLGELASTSNVSASARKARVSTSAVYEARRGNPEFNRAWQRALCEGYEYLEMELLARLRSGEVKPASTARRGVRSFDNGIAFRLLLAHKDSVSRQRAIRDNEDSEAIVQAINAKLEKIRERRSALTAPDPAHEAGPA
ncbi:MAG: hypothetical protein ACKOPM_16065 [Novosphingobium sp.]